MAAPPKSLKSWVIGIIVTLLAVRNLQNSFTIQQHDDDMKEASTWGLPETTITARGTRHHDMNDPRPKGLRLVLVGDSVTRYQYLSLAYFLSHGEWFDPKQQDPHLVNEISFNTTWIGFYNRTNRMLAPHETCDCFRDDLDEATKKSKRLVQESFAFQNENRYFHDTDRDNVVVHIGAMGHVIPPRGRIGGSEALSTTETFRKKYERFLGVERPDPENWTWSYTHWHDLVTEHLARFRPKLTHIMFNAGFWKNQFSNQVVRGQLLDACNLANMTCLWRQTHYMSKGRYYGPEQVTLEINDYFCSAMGCIDMKWTRWLREDLYWDRLHFNEPVYRVVNEELLERYGHVFPGNYDKFSRNSLLQCSSVEKGQSLPDHCRT